MIVELVDHTDNPEEKIGRFASICYNSSTDRDACIRRAKSCLSRGHLATLRFAYATFRIDGISRACSHQLVRSKHLDYLQQSQRYVEQSEQDFVMPHLSIDNSIYLDQAYRAALSEYNYLLKQGVKKEDARYVLPSGVVTSLYVTGNFQAWKDFIKLRSGKEVQWEIRAVAHKINEALGTIAPNLFGELNGT